MTDDFERDPITDALRASLAAHAAEAPRGEILAERIVAVATAQADPRERRRRSWRTWTLPLVAAGAVAGVVAAVVGIESYHPSASPPAGSHSPVSPSPAVSTPSGVIHTTTAPSVTPTDTGSLQGVKILDVTFAYGTGWALASADCVQHPGTRCTALLRTTDGTTWKSMSGTPFNVAGVTGGCTVRCVTHIRFATKDVGYVYGPNALLMTTDGGASWTLQPGGALYLETLDNNVIRVTGTDGGCPGPCNIQVETSDIGSTAWTPATLSPAMVDAGGLSFARGGSNAYLLVTQHPAGGAANQASTLYRSSDDGRTWTASPEPCPQTGQEAESYAVAGGRDSLVSVLCATRQAPQRWFVATSTDGGAHFAAQPGVVPAATARLLTGDPTTVLVTAGDGLARSTDGGTTWHRVRGVTDRIGFVGFESGTEGRAVSVDGRTIWTTTDAGRTWTPKSFR